MNLVDELHAIAATLRVGGGLERLAGGEDDA
jgi:hypothetical protein